MKRVIIVCLMLLSMSIGCIRPPAQPEPQPPVPLEVLEETLRWARENIETLEQLPLPDTALKDLQRAKNNLRLAESSFAKALYDEAYLSSLESLAISQKLVRQFYKESIVSSARAAKERIEAITVEDPDSPLQEFLPDLTEILDYSEGIEASGQEIDLDKVLADFERVTELSLHAQNTVQRTLESDISFESGAYRLSDRGKQAIAEYCREILRVQQHVADVYPDRAVVIRINLIGYTDQVGFKEGTNLLQLLTAGIDPQAIPQAKVELRKFLNRRLSEFRVATLGDFLEQCLLAAQSGIRVELHGSGRGEELPPGGAPSEQLSDPRRRICKIYTYVLLQSEEK